MSLGSEIVRFYQDGLSYSQIVNELGCSQSTVSQYIRRAGLGHAKRPVYDWSAIQRYHDEGHGYVDCSVRFGFSSCAWADAVRTGKIKTRERKDPLEECLVEGKYVRSSSLRVRLIEEGVLAYECGLCGISDWNGKPLTLHLDHVNGNHKDNRLENLRLLCPNCHSQTPNYCAKNRKSYVARVREGEKKCTGCHNFKSVVEFNSAGRSLRSYCRSCEKGRSSTRREELKKRSV